MITIQRSDELILEHYLNNKDMEAKGNNQSIFTLLINYGFIYKDMQIKHQIPFGHNLIPNGLECKHVFSHTTEKCL